MNLIRSFLLLTTLVSTAFAGADGARQQPAAPTSSAVSLDSVLATMDHTSQQFRTAQADFKWDQLESAVNEHDLQSGTIYFQRNGGRLQMMAHVTDPRNAEKYALYDGNSVRLFDVAPNRVTEYGTGNNKETFETFLVLGFGGSGQDLKRSFTVTLDGMETVDNVNAARLLLVPKSEKARNVFDRIYMWINPANGVAVREKFMEPQTGNYRDSFYTNIQINKPLPRDAFKLPTNAKTQTVRPQG